MTELDTLHAATSDPTALVGAGSGIVPDMAFAASRWQLAERAALKLPMGEDDADGQHQP